jgi:hypothetical protein
MTLMCRSLPPTLRISVSPLEKSDAQIQMARVGFVPTTDPRSMEVRDNLRPVSVAFCKAQCSSKLVIRCRYIVCHYVWIVPLVSVSTAWSGCPGLRVFHY